jgi:hypothetical protein
MAIDLPPGVADDLSIAGPTRLLRRVHKCQVNDGQIDSSVFLEREKGCGLSVTIWESPSDLDDILGNYILYSLAVFG